MTSSFVGFDKSMPIAFSASSWAFLIALLLLYVWLGLFDGASTALRHVPMCPYLWCNHPLLFLHGAPMGSLLQLCLFLELGCIANGLLELDQDRCNSFYLLVSFFFLLLEFLHYATAWVL